MPVIGYLHSSSAETNVNFLTGVPQRLERMGLCRGPERGDRIPLGCGRIDRLPELASHLVRRRVAVIATPADAPATLAAKAATKAIPIVFAIGADPVELGLVKSLNRPDGNVTGIAFQTVELTTKRLGMLRELAPQAVRFGVLVDPAFAFNASLVKDVQASAAALRLPVDVLDGEHAPKSTRLSPRSRNNPEAQLQGWSRTHSSPRAAPSLLCSRNTRDSGGV